MKDFNIRILSKVALLLFLFPITAFGGIKDSDELSGEVIFNDTCNETQYPVSNAFDGDLNTYFRSCPPFGSWIGLDLGAKHVITQVAFCPRTDSDYRDRLQLGVFEGANNPDFGDAVTLFVIPGSTERELTQQLISCSRGFRYVRFVFPYAQVNWKSSYMGELKFYGYQSEGDDSHLPQITNLPTVSIHTVDAVDITSKEEYVQGIVSIIYDNGSKVFVDSLQIKGRGNNSWSQPKKPYRLKLYNSTHLLDLPAKSKNWTLINNYGDKTLMRNILAFDFSKRLQMPYTSPAEAVDVVLNGDYKGCYQLCDHIDVRDNRIEVEEFDATTDETGYLVEIDAYAYWEEKNFTSQAYNIPVTINYPEDDEITAVQESYISAHFEKFVSSVQSANYDDKVNGFRKYLDEGTFLRHFLVGEYSGNTDTYWSVKMAKRINDDKFYLGPVWDFDLGFENDHRTYSITDHAIEYNEWVCFWDGMSSAAGNTREAIRRIMSDDEMVASLSQIYSQYRNNGEITKAVLENVVDSCAALLAESQDLNFKRWQILDILVHENPIIYGSYEAEVDNVRNYIMNRIDWLDSKLNYVPSVVNLNQLSEKLSVHIYSANHTLFVRNLKEYSNIKVFDIYGVLRCEKQNIQELSLPLEKGIYLILIEQGNRKYSYKYPVY